MFRGLLTFLCCYGHVKGATGDGSCVPAASTLSFPMEYVVYYRYSPCFLVYSYTYSLG